jgi:hypothetical protein
MWYYDGRPERRTTRRILKDLLVYTTIAVVLVAFALFFAIHQANTGQPAEISDKWLGLSVLTGLVLIYAIRSHRTHWKELKFWALVTAFAILHLGAGFVIVSRLGKISQIYFALAGLLEYFVLTAYLDYFLVRKK